MQRNKRKKHYFLKLIFFMLVLCGIGFYSASFPVTMELLDKKVNGILEIFDLKSDFKIFSFFSDVSKTAINKAEYWFEIAKENIEKSNMESKPVSAIRITCAAKFPLENKKITSAFGKRKDPVSGKNSIHSGIDIAAEEGTKIVAVWPGNVSETGFDDIYGNYVIIKHSKDFYTKYCHLSKITISENSFVMTDDKIGEVGSTGRSTGNHLHFEIIVEGRKIDPMECFDI